MKTSKTARRVSEGLSPAQIVNAALDMIRRDGADQFSMRQLAKELGVTPMAVYHYFGNKEALLEQVADAVLALIPRPTPSGKDWRGELRASSIEGFRLLSQYPGLSGYIVQRPPGAQSDELTRYGTAILVAAGFEPAASTLAVVTLQAYMFGMIAVQAQLELRLRNASSHTSTGPSRHAPVDVTSWAEYGVDALLTGLAEKLSAPSAGKGRATRVKPRR